MAQGALDQLPEYTKLGHMQYMWFVDQTQDMRCMITAKSNTRIVVEPRLASNILELLFCGCALFYARRVHNMQRDVYFATRRQPHCNPLPEVHELKFRGTSRATVFLIFLPLLLR